MNLEIVLWAGGMLFTLTIFAIKVGFGLGYGRIGAKGIYLTLAGYVGLFVLIALLSNRLIRLLEPLLKNGPYLHAFIAAGMIAWGIFALRGSHLMHRARHDTAHSLLKPSLLLVIPCPVCITAMTFSTWAALSVISLPAALVGLSLGITFAGLSLVFVAISRFRRSETPEISLGLCMIAIGCYFIGSLFLPAKIEEAKSVYTSFLDKGGITDQNSIAGVMLTLLTALLIGFFIKNRTRSTQNEYSRRT